MNKVLRIGSASLKFDFSLMNKVLGRSLFLSCILLFPWGEIQAASMEESQLLSGRAALSSTLLAVLPMLECLLKFDISAQYPPDVCLFV